MELTEFKLKDFLAEIDSKSPAPGGGSVAALAAVLGVCLARMVGHLTMGKKRFEAYGEETKNECLLVMTKLERVKEEVIGLISSDSDAFNQVMAAYKLPKDSADEKALRDHAVQDATIQAIEVPLKVAKVTFEALENIFHVIKYGNPNTLSDLGVAVLMLSSGIEGAIMNVKINLPGVSNRVVANAYFKEAEGLLERCNVIRQELLISVHNRLNLM